MKALTTFFLVLFAVSHFVPSLTAQTNISVEKNASKAVSKWLELIDNGRYLESWEESAGYFKEAVDKDEWQKTLKAVRKPLGGVVWRKLKSLSETSNLPGAPDGKYVVIQYSTWFENKKSALETVTSAFSEERGWRICGYYIR
ncbi:MAG: DUF4019 domain-containing protein [Candidatus Omnitrophica bacterium]|nr:DUF4019 domain-containing protein [Candidatus Omnitrophota bacterium]MBD3269169.1 DUF4019 domain-containing protein [Candidatus Omnitrophota bacterium]